MLRRSLALVLRVVGSHSRVSADSRQGQICDFDRAYCLGSVDMKVREIGLRNPNPGPGMGQAQCR